jgi:GH18 family chitinase
LLVIEVILLPYVFAHISNFSVIGYLPEWRYEGANFDTICSHVSHLIFFSVEPSSNGDIIGKDRLPRDHILKDAQRAAKDHGCNLLVCFGGNGRSSGFSSMVRSKAARAKFIENVKNMLKNTRMSGVDYNWEYPGYQFQSGYNNDVEVQKDYKGLRLLLKETRENLGNEKIITLAYYPDGRQEKFLHDIKADLYVDFMHMMSYDQNNGHHSTFEFGKKSVLQGIESGLAPKKLTMGLPFYGRNSVGGDWTTYEDIVQKYHPLDFAVDRVGVKPLDKARGDAFIGFNGRNLISKKVLFAMNQGIGGVMIWEVGQDCRFVSIVREGKTHGVTCPHGQNSSLLTAISSVIDQKIEIVIDNEL